MDLEVRRYLTRYNLVSAEWLPEPWQRLSIFESRDLLSRFYRDRHGHGANAGKIEEIACHLSQGRDYFAAAGRAEPLVFPLLLYYGVLALSRALVLFLSPRARETALSQSHGLEAVGWDHQFARGISELPNIRIRLGSGTFTELVQATQNREMISVSDETRRTHHRLTQVGSIQVRSGQEVTLKDIWSRVPDLNPAYQTAFNELARCYPCLVQLHPGYGAWIVVINTDRGLPSEATLRRDLPIPSDTQFDFAEHYHALGDVPNVTFWMPRRDQPGTEQRKFSETTDLPPIKNDGDGISYLVSPLESELRLSSLALLFIISYASGMLARYFPTSLASLMGRRPGDFALPLLNTSNSMVERRFPELILKELERRE